MKLRITQKKGKVSIWFPPIDKKFKDNKRKKQDHVKDVLRLLFRAKGLYPLIEILENDTLSIKLCSRGSTLRGLGVERVTTFTMSNMADVMMSHIIGRFIKDCHVDFQEMRIVGIFMDLNRHTEIEF